MFDWLKPEHTVAASIVISLLSYFLSLRLPIYAQARMLRTAALYLIGCSTVYGWAMTDSLKFGFYTFSCGYLPIFIYIIWNYFRDHAGIGSVIDNKVTPANFQFNTKKQTPKSAINDAVSEVQAETVTEPPVDDTTKDTGE
jgi:hypothetical protein